MDYFCNKIGLDITKTNLQNNFYTPGHPPVITLKYLGLIWPGDCKILTKVGLQLIPWCLFPTEASAAKTNLV